MSTKKKTNRKHVVDWKNYKLCVHGCQYNWKDMLFDKAANTSLPGLIVSVGLSVATVLFTLMYGIVMIIKAAQ